jgi:Ca2+-binding EF-hand superfamily protein
MMAFMASEFQRRKVARVFDAMDADGDRFLERSDFEALTARWTENRGWRSGSEGHDRLTRTMMSWWETVLAASDQDRDEKVTLDEVLVVVDRLGTMLDAVTRTAAVMFEAIDENTDGWISAEEYRQLIETWTGRTTDTDEVFARLDLDGDGQLSNREFIELWTQFWVGDDPDQPGTWVFGKVDLPESSGA